MAVKKGDSDWKLDIYFGLRVTCLLKLYDLAFFDLIGLWITCLDLT